MIERRMVETVTGSVAAKEIRERLASWFTSKSKEWAISKVEEYSDGLYLTFENGQRFDIPIIEPALVRAESHLRYASIDDLIVELRSRIK